MDIADHSFEKAEVKFKPLGDKLVKDGKTAILTNSKWGLCIDEFRCDPVIINLILDKKKYRSPTNRDYKSEETTKYNDKVNEFNNNIDKQITDYCIAKYSFVAFKYQTFWPNWLTVHWIPINTFFIISNCGDNGESIITVQGHEWTKA